MKINWEHIPFTLSSTSELQKINLMKFCHYLPELDTTFSNLSIPDAQLSLPTLLNNKYNNVYDIQKLKNAQEH